MVTIQDYRGVMRAGGLRVGSFLPGDIECSPGDTPKVWPEKKQYVHTQEEALVLFEGYVKEALADGWLEQMLG